jgi:glucose/arabinose dehydrogenase
VAGGGAAASAAEAPALSLRAFATGLEAPVLVTGDGTGSGRLYAVEQAGRIRLLSPDGLVREAPFLDISGRISAGGERGLLLVGMGDGGGGGDPQDNAQDRRSLLGKLLRIDVDAAEPYATPADNPFADGALAEPEIWAIGLRNPWRFSVDRLTGDVWIGDVGQSAFEEVDRIAAGQGGLDLGWNVMEGRSCFGDADCDTEGLTLPVATFGHDAGVCSIVGGYVYRGDRIPALVGDYVLSDYCSGDLWLLAADEVVAGTAVEPLLAGHHDGRIVSFGEDDAGELYVVDHGGTILRLEAGSSASDRWLAAVPMARSRGAATSHGS